MKKILMISMGLLLSILVACSPQPLQTIGADKYFVEIDQEATEVGDEEHTRYEYTLDGVDREAEIKELTFTAGRELRQGAYLKIYVKGDEIITYEEVDMDEMPKEAQGFFE